MMPSSLRCCFFSLVALLSASYLVEGNNNNNNNDASSYTVCQDAAIAVTDLVLVCDSPGAYYYGSGKYRNSATCKAGDKAKLSVQMEIVDDIMGDDDAFDSKAYMTIAITGYGTVSGVSLLSDVDICDVLTPRSKYVTCPEPGNYTLYDRFYWGNQDDTDAYEYSFRPQVTIGLSSKANSNKYDLGGANTNKCSDGTTFVQWITTDVRMSMANTFKSFIVTFGLLTGTLFGVGITAWWVVRQARRLQHDARKSLIVVDEEVDAPYTAMQQQRGGVNV